MKKRFYHLGRPGPTKPHQVYGHAKWYGTFDSAEWSEMSAGFLTGRLYPPFGEPRKDLAIVLPNAKVGDFVWSCYSDCFVPDRTLALFTEAGFTGFETRQVIIEKIRGPRPKRGKAVPDISLWELLIKGKGGEAAPESGIAPLQYENSSGVVRNGYTSFRNGIIVDESNWDGSDFFTVNGYPKYLLVTEQVKELIIGRQLTNCALIPSDKLLWGSSVTLEGSVAESVELANRPFESLMAELEDPETVGQALYGLGCKEDPRAIDPIIERLGHPDPSIWNTAADALAGIATHKLSTDQTKEEIFTKLAALLLHEDLRVRKGAATALGNIGSERAIQEVVKLLDDPHEFIRHRAVFIIGFRYYRPALEAVRRLTRDRSNTVRKMARLVAAKLECQFR
jgi:hypothetical protein